MEVIGSLLLSGQHMYCEHYVLTRKVKMIPNFLLWNFYVANFPPNMYVCIMYHLQMASWPRHVLRDTKL
jgi:hypothetical protein